MNSIFREFGVEGYVLMHNARHVVMREATWSRCFHLKQRQRSRSNAEEFIITKEITNLADHYDYDYSSGVDDDEFSNCSTEGETSCSSASSSDELNNSICNRVSFCSPLVTATYVRPSTTSQEKFELYYTDMDYREFRRNYIVMNRIQTCRLQYEARSKRRNVVVQIHPDVVTAIHTIPNNEDPTELYYSQSDLQGYVTLDSCCLHRSRFY